MKLIKTTLALMIGASIAMGAQAESTLDKIKASGTMTIAYREASIPFSYLNDKAQPVGFAWELSNKVADAVKAELGLTTLTIKTQAVTSANRIPLINNNTVDIECGSTTNNATRAKEVDFSVNFFYAGVKFLVRTDSGIKTLADLKGKTAVSTNGTTPLQLLQTTNHQQKLGIRIITANDHDTSFINVQQNLAHAFVMDDILLYGLRAASAKPTDYVVVGAPLSVEPYACMIRKGDPEFKALVNKTIIDLMDSGEFTAMYDKWFTKPIPPKGINLELPMSTELKANLTAHSDKAID